ncbi:hypothetical protein [Winogradskyella sp. 3972H.M.0a.05]|uniref:hypothetical protein n=1 Tax=Winogradskyella sp. 3972H.M.0a.05 TaxID=2950277 RepID=UPI00339ABDE2
MSKKNPIINCHAHVFTGDYVPPYLAKTFLIWPFYYLLSLRAVINCLRWYHNKIKPFFFTNKVKKIKRWFYESEIFFRRNYLLGTIKRLAEIYLIVSILFYVGLWQYDITEPQDTLIGKWVVKALIFIKDSGWIIVVPKLWLKILYLVLVLIVFKSIRNLAISVLNIFKILPGKNFKKLFSRYVQIGMFSKYKTQSRIYQQLEKQYPQDTEFIVLPMDMEYMQAGKLKPEFTINSQMEGILKIKKTNKETCHPFVFAEPSRMKDKAYFDYEVDKSTGEVSLVKGCLVQEYLEEHDFAGIKMYPALGYYPFDEELLPLWKYCVQRDLPIMSHCIKGTIFFRGKKKSEWDEHPIFTEGKIDEAMRKTTEHDKKLDFDIDADYILEDGKPLYLNEIKNVDFCNNFTHPLNYLCLLNDELLKKVVSQTKDPRIINIFYDNDGEYRGEGLSDLKICFAHFGGDDQWKRFLESDRDNYTSQLVLKPDKGIDFFMNASGKPSPGKLAYVWRYVDWYSIICSIILQHKNVYADISYILHDEIILPLLKQTLANDKLQEHVLYGSDFYVVRNHKSDKELLADMRAGLSEVEFDQIARENPRAYLNLD